MNQYFIMTVDVDPPFSSLQNYIIIEGVTSILNLFKKNKIKATFFVPAIVAKNFPYVIEEITKYDHEIACHGLKHHPDEGTQSIVKQFKMIKVATEIIESITGIKPVGFRAPLFRINKNCLVALQKNDYLYDSSLLGFSIAGKQFLFSQMKPFSIKISNSETKHKNAELFELPVSTNLFPPFPVGGGWFRIFGLKWAKIGVKINFMLQNMVVFYIHPKDVVEIRTPNLSWYNYRDTAETRGRLFSIIQYSKANGAKFLRAYDFVKMFEYNPDFSNFRTVFGIK